MAPLTLCLSGGVGGEAQAARDLDRSEGGGPAGAPAINLLRALQGRQALDGAQLEGSDAVQVAGGEGEGELVWTEEEALSSGDG